MKKDKITYEDGEEVEIEIPFLGFRQAGQIAKKHIPINDLTMHPDDSLNIKGDIDIVGLREECLMKIKGIDIDRLPADEGIRIYNEYFHKQVMGVLGQGGNPKSRKS